jgi:soluble lytic murein transglycosylase-like protein
MTSYSTSEVIFESPSTVFWTVDSPLNREQESQHPLRVTHQDLMPDAAGDYMQQRMLIILIFTVAGLILFAGLAIPLINLEKENLAAKSNQVAFMAEPEMFNNESVLGVGLLGNGGGEISPIFDPAVQHWAPQILRWAAMHDLDPDMVATVMQIESCGDPQALSIAGAQGLFQVMPFHFVAGENAFDPDTNALRGMNYLAERLEQTRGDVGLAFAGYNGGHVAAGSSWNQWPHETQRYYVWSTGIYADAKAGLGESPTLRQWMAAGGVSLCSQAAQRLGLPQ